MDSTYLYIKEEPQLFVDNLVIEASMDLTRRWYHPAKDSRPLIVKDRPWEHVPYFTYSNYCVLKDPQDGLFKCWYEDLQLRKTGKMTGRWFGACQCYAESKDGLHWDKPELDVRVVDGRKTNIIFGGDQRGEVHSANIVLDPHPPRPEERFRMLYTLMLDDEPDKIECAYSADGIYWTPYPALPAFGISGPNLNDVSVIFYDELARCFVMNTRHFLQWAGNVRDMPAMGNKPHSEWNCPNNFALLNRRRVWQTHSPDFLHWSEPVLIADIDDDQDNLDTSLYGMSQFKVGTLNLGFAGMIHIVDNTMDVHLLSSRDGVRWQRGYQRQPFLSPGCENAWDRYMVSIVSPPVEIGDELWFFHGGSKSHHDWWYVNSVEDFDHPENRAPEKHVFYGLGRAVLRKNGFASLAANAWREGALVTRSVVSNGTRLLINARCNKGGFIKAEVLDGENRIIPGFEKEKCIPFHADSVNHELTWQGQKEILKKGVYHRLHFFLKDAEFFSFQLARPAEMNFKQNKWGNL